MGWNRPDEDTRADHYRDERKHDPRPGDIPTAVEVASLVKQLPNVMDGAALIERYVAERFSQQRLEAVAAGARP